MPECTGSEGGHAGSETRFLAARRDAQVDVVPEPVVGVDVPITQVGPSILGGLDPPRVDVLKSIPGYPPRHRIDSLIAEARKDASAFCQRPDAVILQSRCETKHVEYPYPVGQSICHVFVASQEVGIVPATKLQEQDNPEDARGSFPCSWGSTSRDFSLLARRGLFGRVDSCWNFEHGGLDPAPVIDIIESWPSKKRREEKYIASVVEDARKFLECLLFLEVGKLLVWQSAIGHVPAESRELHHENHLGASDVH